MVSSSSTVRQNAETRPCFESPDGQVPAARPTDCDLPFLNRRPGSIHRHATMRTLNPLLYLEVFGVQVPGALRCLSRSIGPPGASMSVWILLGDASRAGKMPVLRTAFVGAHVSLDHSGACRTARKRGKRSEPCRVRIGGVRSGCGASSIRRRVPTDRSIQIGPRLDRRPSPPRRRFGDRCRRPGGEAECRDPSALWCR